MKPHMININIHQSGQGILYEINNEFQMNNCCYLYDKYDVQFRKKICLKKVRLIHANIRYISRGG